MSHAQRFILTILMLVPVTALKGAGIEKPGARPNIVVIITDDVGWGDFRCYNKDGKIPSPNIDRLAREGIRFSNAHSAAALCSPTRYSMLTGNYPWRGRDPDGGTWGFNVPSAILPGQMTVADLLGAAGYRTALIGKSGIGGQHHVRPAGGPDFTRRMIDGPKRWGFGYSFIIPRGHQDLPHLFLENELPSCGAANVVRGLAYADFSDPDWDESKIGGRLLDAAEGFVDKVLAANRVTGRNKPFFLQFNTDGAHWPYAPAGRIRGTVLKGRTGMTSHTDMVFETDLLLGKLMAILRQRGLLDDTLICFTSDNGGLPDERQLGHDAVGGLRGRKAYIAEGGHRVPFLIRWPDRIPAGIVRDQMVCTHDIVPTALELAGVKIPAGQCLDSVSLLPVLTGGRDDSRPVRESLLVEAGLGRDAFDDGELLPDGEAPFDPEESLGGEQGSGSEKPEEFRSTSNGMAHALYVGDWKLVLDIADQPAALYHLKADLVESDNLLSSEPGRVIAMEKTYREIRASKRSTAISRSKP